MALQIEGKKIYDKESETTSGVKTKQKKQIAAQYYIRLY